MKTSPRRLSLALALLSLVIGGTALDQSNAMPAGASLADFQCLIYVDHPHASHHVPGMTNVVGRVECGQVMEDLYIRVSLHKQGGGEWAGEAVDCRGTSAVEGSAAADCSESPGQFWGEARVTAVPPAGWSPPSSSGAANGFVLPLACGDPILGGSPDESSRSVVVLGTLDFAVLH